MSFSFKNKKGAIPVAKIKGLNKIIYLYPEDKTYNEVPEVNVDAYTYTCPYCKKIFNSKRSLIYHVSKICPVKEKTMQMFPSIRTQGELLQKLPLNEHEIIFVTGPPNSGKTWWVNDYGKAYKTLFGGNIYLITTHEHDKTLSKNEDMYINIAVTDELLKEPFELPDFHDSLVIFDDIETSKYPKATKYIFNLLDDICKNGRHHNINCIFVNQECRMAKLTKRILSMFTGLVVFPSSGETYQITKLLQEYCGMSKARINKIMALNTRWVYFSRTRPQYIMAETSCFILGKEIYAR